MKNKILVGIPIIFNAEMCNRAIDGVVNEADVVIVDNGSLHLQRDDIYCISNPHNNFVCPAWNQILHFFLHNDYQTLIIMNSDLVMQAGWSEKLDAAQICIPSDGSHLQDAVVTEGTPGVFIHLSREMAEVIYPLPDYLKLWFGDNFIFDALRGLGYRTVVKAGLVGEHIDGGSKSMNELPCKSEIIEQDKAAWALYGHVDVLDRINKFKK